MDVGKTLALPSIATIPTGAELSVTSAAPSIATATVGEDGKTITITSVAPGAATITAAAASAEQSFG